MKKWKLILVSLLCIIVLAACGKSSEGNNQVQVAKPDKLPVATIIVKDFGTIQAELYPHMAPNTVYNFMALANDGFYDGLTFHRVVKDFVIQGGDPEGNGMGGPGYSIKGEFKDNDFNNELKHDEGILSMARSQDYDSGGSQFFITTVPTPSLDNAYAAFGKVTSGMDIVKKIEAVSVGMNDMPKTPIVIEKITIDTFGETYPKPEKIK